MTAGTAMREVAASLENQEAKVAGIIVALDREKSQSEQSAIQELAQNLNVPVPLGHDGWHYRYVAKMARREELAKMQATASNKRSIILVLSPNPPLTIDYFN